MIRRFLPLVQAVFVVCGAFVAMPARASDVQCTAVAEATSKMQSELASAWESKQAGDKDAAFQKARDVVAALSAGYANGWRRCMSAEGRLRAIALLSKAILLLADLEDTTRTLKGSLSASRVAIDDARPIRSANLAYWRSINADYGKVQARYNAVARDEARAAQARREAVLRVTHPHESEADVNSIINMDAARARPQRRATPIPVPKPGACARPNVPATTIHAAEPITPPVGQEQGIAGDVQVAVSLNENSQVTAVRILSSPSVVLNEAALNAARASTFQTEIRNCIPIPADYIFTASFTSQ
ncbi:MAG TPA: energy transducer TonB [Candidatus Baltobacteraceae bacterium]|nr:energy transducer TonB [Candidatus Baltobacteraceae bacterium]